MGDGARRWWGVVVVLLMTAVAPGCGGGNHVGVQNADTPSIPKMPTPMPGNASVAGRVLDSDGQGVPGATIKVAETDGTASSDATGAYQLVVPGFDPHLPDIGTGFRAKLPGIDRGRGPGCR